MPSAVSVSIVSHRQAELVAHLLHDIEAHCVVSDVTAHVTLNVPEPLPFGPRDFSYDISIHVNPQPRGFAANQNDAFRRSTADFFCVMNPDIRLGSNPFPTLQATLTRPEVGAVAPLVRDTSGGLQDNARRLPTLGSLISRFLRGPEAEYSLTNAPLAVDWLAGMFILFPSKVFAAAGGFNERYWLYYEDAELCTRLRLTGYRVLIDPGATVIHDAQRASHRRLRHLAWHVSSALRLLTSRVYRTARAHPSHDGP